jgi:hypothetical protein
VLPAVAPDQQQMQHNEDVRQQRLQRQQALQQQLLHQAKEQAKARFWDLLVDFAVMRASPGGWQRQVGADHPLLQFRLGPDGRRTLCVAAAVP